ncbi:hypothetical protein EU811_22190 [Arthrobacter sp. TS-15]|uniref:hypothetical protein n=1 Tax=unclassified Arthrobacter TaxID=235627 RepID=UPI00115ED1C4|nr:MULTISPECIES: hypothetical protein [unclassified Arthrobacter]QSZ51469.1 hypothetical protein AYX22_23480 [Arthrobacter sp. D5-1]TQS87720.1 hypothetical protein EU811_22190 [Arthrobacter sp. TS-15]
MSNATTAPKGITALIYRDALGTDFSNQGISARVMEVTVIGEGIDPVFEATEERPAVRLVKNESLHRETVTHAEPVAPDDETAPWYMFGGTFIFSSDSRFRRAAGQYGAIPLHDRRE